MKSVIREGRDPALEQRRVHAGVRKLRTLNDLIAEYLTRREDLTNAPAEMHPDLIVEDLRELL